MYINILVRVMGRLLVVIDDDLEEEFRKIVAKIYGFKKGALSRAIEEAIRLWLKKYSR